MRAEKKGTEKAQTWQLHCGDALAVLRTLPDGCVDCVVTSPPYWGLRNYGHDGQFGLEASPAQFVASLVAVMGECRRVMCDDSTLWLNLGDSYIGGGRGGNPEESQFRKQATNAGSLVERTAVPNGYKAKDLAGIPWSVAFALRNDGWYLRSEIIWHKKSCMPESVKDRPTKAHEQVFLLTKQSRYFYDAAAIAEPSVTGDLRRPYGSAGAWELDGRPESQRHGGKIREIYKGKAQKDYSGNGVQDPSATKSRILESELVPANARTVWSLGPEPATDIDHFAVMPKTLARRCILAGCPFGGTVLDPFAGSGTTGIVALEEGRSFIGIELNPKYHAMARERLANTSPLLAQEVSA